MADGDLTLAINGAAISGWMQIAVTAGVERCTRSFSIGMTERFPGEISSVVMQAGDPCVVKIGPDTVITGFIDRYSPRISAVERSIRVVGRGKCQDLVDASAEWPSGQISGSTVIGVAQKLAEPYGISVAAAQVEIGPAIPQFNLNVGESAWDIIERICRFRGLLAYELSDGSLFLSRVGTQSMASGFVEGKNVEHAEITYSADQRFSQYLVYGLSLVQLSDVSTLPYQVAASSVDPNVKRHRIKLFLEEFNTVLYDIQKLRADWEAARRMGRAQTVHLTTDSWRDGAGALWQPNMLVPVELPSLKMQRTSLAISEVTFLRDENGTHAELTLMPPQAFLPQPVILDPGMADIIKAATDARDQQGP